MGDGLRRCEPAAAHAPEVHLTHAAMVTRRDANRVYMLCALPRSHFSANLHLLDGVRSLDRVPAISRNEWLAGMVARRLGDCVYVEPERRPGDLCLGYDWRASAPNHFCSWSKHIAGVESEDG